MNRTVVSFRLWTEASQATFHGLQYHIVQWFGTESQFKTWYSVLNSAMDILVLVRYLLKSRLILHWQRSFPYFTIPFTMIATVYIVFTFTYVFFVHSGLVWLHNSPYTWTSFGNSIWTFKQMFLLYFIKDYDVAQETICHQQDKYIFFAALTGYKSIANRRVENW